MGFLDDGVRRFQVTLAVIFLVACAGYLLAIHFTGIETEVMRDRFPSADALLSGDIPPTEYPPLALLFVAIPRIFADTPFGYNVAFVAEMYLFMVAGLLMSSRLAAAMGRDERRAMVLYSVMTLLMLEFVLDRFDVIPAVMTLAALYLFVTGRREWAFVLLALGTLTKIYPALLFPVLFLFLAYNREWRDAVRGTVAFVGTGVVAIAVCIMVDPDLITGFLGYHEDRPLQLESVASSVIYLLSMFGLTDVWIQSATANRSILLREELLPRRCIETITLRKTTILRKRSCKTSLPIPFPPICSAVLRAKILWRHIWATPRIRREKTAGIPRIGSSPTLANKRARPYSKPKRTAKTNKIF